MAPEVSRLRLNRHIPPKMLAVEGRLMSLPTLCETRESNSTCIAARQWAASGLAMACAYVGLSALCDPRVTAAYDTTLPYRFGARVVREGREGGAGRGMVCETGGSSGSGAGGGEGGREGGTELSPDDNVLSTGVCVSMYSSSSSSVECPCVYCCRRGKYDLLKVTSLETRIFLPVGAQSRYALDPAS